MTHLDANQVREAINRLNNNYGKGSLASTVHYLDGRIACTSELQYGYSKFTARVDGRTVYARGHQLTVKA